MYLESRKEESTLTWISTDEHCCSPKFTAGRYRVSLVIAVESIRRMGLEGIWIVAAP
jgi:hypothetical protein